MKTINTLTRRHFLRNAGLAGSSLLILASARSAWTAQANSKINVALVGVGGRGEWFVDTIPRMENVVAICDVNEQKIAAALKRWEDGAQTLASSQQEWERRAAESYKRQLVNKPKIFQDFRKMLEQEGKGIDAVIVATPDHTHAVVSAAAIRAGKHVFCEKPLTRTLHESRALREIAREHKVITSMGNQGTYSGAFRRALELIRNGTIGEVKEVQVWNDGGGQDKTQPPQGEKPVPAHLQWDLWLGPAKQRPYNPEWINRHAWREFGTCQLGNWGSHTANLGFMALKVHDLWLSQKPQQASSVLKIQAKTSGINRLSFPRWEHVQWEVPSRAEFGPITINWHNGNTPGTRELLQKIYGSESEKERSGWRFAGTYIVGTKGAIHATGHNMWFRLMPEEKFQGVKRDRPETVENSSGAEQDWFAGCRSGKRPWANFDYADALNEFLMLGNVATQFEDKLEFDPLAMKVVNNSEADAILRSEYRTGWTL